MESLTKREKILIYVLVCFLLVVAGWFLLITPALEKNTLLNAQNVNLQSQILTLKKTLKDYESAPAELKIIEESYDKIADQ
ncbi:type II secretion system protein GspM [Longibaculum muris]|uniref:type II secretion system protein GspM n=1 Tax=Longibaculum muris TaxID=1796628 RepID=UPI0022DFF345|nr:type II secretion system protein GspM [Longibaculum muris]